MVTETAANTKEAAGGISKAVQRIREAVFIIFHAAIKVHRLRFYQLVLFFVVLYIQNLYFVFSDDVSVL